MLFCWYLAVLARYAVASATTAELVSAFYSCNPNETVSASIMGELAAGKAGELLLQVYEHRPSNASNVEFFKSFNTFVGPETHAHLVAAIYQSLPAVVLEAMKRDRLLCIYMDPPLLSIFESGSKRLDSTMSQEAIDAWFMPDWYLRVNNVNKIVTLLHKTRPGSYLKHRLFSSLARLEILKGLDAESCTFIIQHFGLALCTDVASSQVALLLKSTPDTQARPVLYNDEMYQNDKDDALFQQFNLTFWHLHVDPAQLADELHSFQAIYAQEGPLCRKLFDQVTMHPRALNDSDPSSRNVELMTRFSSALKQRQASIIRIRELSYILWAAIVILGFKTMSS